MMKESRQARERIRPAGTNGTADGGSIRAHANSSGFRSAAMTAAGGGSGPVTALRARPSRLLQSEAVQGFALISPPFLYALVLLAVTILIVIAHSFWPQNYLTIYHN